MDTRGVSNSLTYGSAHPAALNMAFCDGSVHSIRYEIEPYIHQWLANRADSNAIDMSKVQP